MARFSCPPDASAGGRDEPATKQGGHRQIPREASVSQIDGANEPPLAKHPLYPAGHLPHCVVENVREPRSHLHPDREHRQHLESLRHHELRSVEPTTNPVDSG